MIFYEDFLKSLNEANFQLEKIEKFHPEVKKLISGIGVGIPLLLIGLFQGYLAKVEPKLALARGGFALILLFLGVKQLKTILSYKILIDTEKKTMKFTNLDVDLAKIESCTLKEGKVGKRLETVLDIITEDKKQYIIPLYMNKKIKFVYILKFILQEKFNIEK